MGMLEDARDDLMAAYKAEPGNKDVRRELQAVKDKMLEAKKREKSAFGGLFNKVG
jgi:hypothetical protein